MMVNALLVSKIFVTYIHAQENIKSSIFSCCALKKLSISVPILDFLIKNMFDDLDTFIAAGATFHYMVTCITRVLNEWVFP